jgi:hypothetical protein
MPDQRILDYLKRLASTAESSRSLSQKEVEHLRALVPSNRAKSEDEVPPWERRSNVSSKERFDPMAYGIGLPPLESPVYSIEASQSF